MYFCAIAIIIQKKLKCCVLVLSWCLCNRLLRVRCRTGCYLLFLFLVAKVFYILNAVGQLFVLNTVLAAKYTTFGADIVRNMADNVDWTEESYVAFPRVTLCEFKARGQDMVNVHPYTVQCVLPINLYNEKIYVFLWFWMIIVAAASVLR
jgi:innexin